MILVLIMLAMFFTLNWIFMITGMLVKRDIPSASPAILHAILAVLYTTIGYMVLHQ